MNPVETYLRELREIHSTGAAVPETSYYGCLERLFNEVGKTLKPKVRCVINLANRGAGIPDGGLFTPDQIRKDDPNPMQGQPPSRGVIEVKSTAADVAEIAASEQVARYCRKYGLVLVTNYRDFAIVARGREGAAPVILESYRLAASEDEFWSVAAHPRPAAEKHGERFVGYLMRAMQHNAPLADPKDLAWFLASYARDALARVKGSNLPALASLRAALEESLGMKFRGDRGEHFFESTLIQTLFYGVFSAWVLWAKETGAMLPRRCCSRKHGRSTEQDMLPGKNPEAWHPAHATFDWMHSSSYLRVPVLRKLFHEFSEQGQLEDLNLVEVLNWATAALNRVDRAAFFENFQQHHAVQYFYEPFLEAYDPELRKQLGVWYTPPEIVTYMVKRVDRVLREELGVADGLADPRVYVLDPCCGTGAFLVGVLDQIAATLRDKGGDALVSHDLKTAVQQRVFGFEILPAPYVVSHLQLGLRLADLQVPLTGKQRVGVYLTNALTGWKPPKEPQARLPFVEFQEEHDAADSVKQSTPILVILGNPPYNGFSDVAVDEERDLSLAYRTTKKAPKPQGQGLNDLYVRFFRMAERRIVDKTGKGVVCFISNYSWLDGLSHTGMRERYIEAFDKIWIDCLNGDKYKTGKVTPDGKPDPSVFSTEFNREGIQVGTAIALMVKGGPLECGGCDAALDSSRPSQSGVAATALHSAAIAGASAAPRAAISFRHLWGKQKRAELLASADSEGEGVYQTLEPKAELGCPFMPALVGADYLTWPTLPQLMATWVPGVQTKQDTLVVDIDREKLVKRIEDYFDPRITDEVLARQYPGSMDDTDACDARATRSYLVKRGIKREYFVKYAYRPFDSWWLYWEPETKLIGRKAPDYFPQVGPGNLWLTAGQRTRKADFYQPQVTSLLADTHVVENYATLFPLLLHPTGLQAEASNKPEPNLSEQAIAYLQSVFAVQPKGLASSSPGRSPGKRPPEGSSSEGAQSSFDCAVGSALNDDCAPSGLEGKRPAHPGLRPGLEDGCPVGAEAAETLFYHILAVLHAPAYRTENAGALRQDWPRIPLPGTREALEASAALGRQVAALLDVTQAVKGVTAGKIDPELKTIAVITKLPSNEAGHVECGGCDTALDRKRQEAKAASQPPHSKNGLPPAAQINDADDLAVTAGWGNPGRGGITMPAGGKVVRRECEVEELAFAKETAPNGKPRSGPVPTEGLAVRRCSTPENDKAFVLDQTTCDIYLNGKVYWKNIPAEVWEYTLGGYQVIKKWLSYREHKMLGRPLRADEARYVTEMARRIAAILRMQKALDENYERVKTFNRAP